MIKTLKLLALVCLVFYSSFVSCIEPVTTAFLATGGLALSGFGLLYCHVKECCRERWTHHNASGLIRNFRAELIAQHLVERIVSKTITAHLKNKAPKKALVLSFHGWTGSGKNYVADLVATHVYKKGTKSRFVHKFISGHKFPHKEHLKEYKEVLKTSIMDATKKCQRSLFIFDEVEKMPAGLIDVLKPFLDYHSHIDNVDYRENIFIFLSNTIGDGINKETLRHFKAGNDRTTITSKQMESILSVGSFNLDGGLKNSDLILAGLVDFFVPFLPMEKEHVKECIRAEIKRRDERVDEHIVQQVADELDYFPKPDNIFSTTGCKMVAKKLDAFL